MYIYIFWLLLRVHILAIQFVCQMSFLHKHLKIIVIEQNLYVNFFLLFVRNRPVKSMVDFKLDLKEYQLLFSRTLTCKLYFNVVGIIVTKYIFRCNIFWIQFCFKKCSDHFSRDWWKLFYPISLVIVSCVKYYVCADTTIFLYAKI